MQPWQTPSVIGIDATGAQRVAAALGPDGLFVADRDGELLATEPARLARAERLLGRRPVAVFGCWRGGGLLAQVPDELPPGLRAERAADARCFGRDPEVVSALDPAAQASGRSRLQASVATAIARRGIEACWLWCAYRERGRPLEVEPAVVVAGALDRAWVVAVAGGCNQQHVWIGESGAALRLCLAERAEDGQITGYRQVAGSPPRLRLVPTEPAI